MNTLCLFEQERYFDFKQVDSSLDLLDQSFRLRYQVYCLERGFLAPDKYPDKVESDEFDCRSQHFSAYDTQQQIVGSVRLVNYSNGSDYPYQAHCPVFTKIELPPKAETAEVSRLVVTKNYRRRREDNWLGINEGSDEPSPDIAAKRGGHPIIVLGLYRAMYSFSRENNIRYWYAAMERSLARLLARYGFDFSELGPEVDYYGPVTIYIADLRQLEIKIAARNPVLLQWFQGHKISEQALE
jgi:N-acyl amino acid synthase of PEP-CTERM/exosortase system